MNQTAPQNLGAVEIATGTSTPLVSDPSSNLQQPSPSAQLPTMPTLSSSPTSMSKPTTHPKVPPSSKTQRAGKRSGSKTPPLEHLTSSGKPLPKIIAFTNQKGGVGKSTCSVHMQDWLIRQGLKVLLIDADGQQCSSPWASRLGYPFEVIHDPDQLFNRIAELREDRTYDMVVIDGPGNASEITRMILNCADLAMVPIRESFFDVASTTAILQFVRQSQAIRSGLPIATLFFNGINNRTLVYKDAAATVSQCQVTLLDTPIHYRTCIIDSPGQMQTVFALNRKDARDASTQFEQLFVKALEVYCHV